mmetsp:Transcript_40347/g.92620  ORF Transcript_40347/g.92620 Transcript_40347/m.92620 type:complete len:682 (-) Transcript_40347:256-2301(-)
MPQATLSPMLPPTPLPSAAPTHLPTLLLTPTPTPTPTPSSPAPKPTTVLVPPPSLNSSTSTPSSGPTSTPLPTALPTSQARTNGGVLSSAITIVLIAIPALLASLVLCVCSCRCLKKKYILKLERQSAFNTSNPMTGRSIPEAGGTQTAFEMSEIGSETSVQGFNDTFVNIGEMSYLIPIEDIQREARPVAAGGGGQVYKGTLRGKPVAIKSIYSQMTTGQMEELEHEVRMLAQLHFPSIIRLYGVALDGPIAYVVTEWVPLTLMDAPKRADFTAAVFVSVVTQILDGIAYIHDRQICHRDIKPQNILITEGFDVRICDLGMARFGGQRSTDKTMTVGAGTPVYMAPEVLLEGEGDTNHMGHYNGYMWDIYSLAILLWTVWYKKEPFETMSIAKIMYHIAYMDMRPTFEDEPGDYMKLEGPPPQSLQDLCKDMWASEPEDRPDISTAGERFAEQVKPDLLDECSVVLGLDETPGNGRPSNARSEAGRPSQRPSRLMRLASRLTNGLLGQGGSDGQSESEAPSERYSQRTSRRSSTSLSVGPTDVETVKVTLERWTSVEAEAVSSPFVRNGTLSEVKTLKTTHSASSMVDLERNMRLTPLSSVGSAEGGVVTDYHSEAARQLASASVASDSRLSRGSDLSAEDCELSLEGGGGEGGEDDGRHTTISVRRSSATLSSLTADLT